MNEGNLWLATLSKVKAFHFCTKDDASTFSLKQLKKKIVPHYIDVNIDLWMCKKQINYTLFTFIPALWYFADCKRF